jgi:hypothetical protein
VWLCANIHAMADRPRPPFRLVVALALAVPVICSCGSSSTKTTASTDTSSPATQAQFVARASSICEGVRAQEQPLETREESLKQLPVAKAEEQFVSLARQAASIARSAEKQLSALPRPAADEQEIGTLLQAYSAEATDATNLANAAANEESKLGEAATIALARSVALNSASAQKLGMGDCFES